MTNDSKLIAFLAKRRAMMLKRTGMAAATPKTQWRRWSRSLILTYEFVREIYLLLLGDSGGVSLTDSHK